MPTWPIRPALLLSMAALLASCAASTHYRSGMRSMEEGNYPAAVKELEQASALAPADVVFRKDYLRKRDAAIEQLLSKATLANANGDSATAASHYRAVLEFDQQNKQASAGLEAIANVARALDDVSKARVSLMRGDTAEARDWSNRAMARAPDHAEVRALRRDLDKQQAGVMISAPNMSKLYQKPINLEFRDASVKMVFEALSRTTGINFIFDRDVRGDLRTTVFLKQTTLEDAIDVILTTNQLDKKVLNASSVLIYPANPAKVKEYQDLMVRAFYLANVEAKQAANLLKTVLKVKDVFIDDKYNMLVLRESAETIALAEKLIALHDLEEPEVMLDVEVLEVNRSRLLNLGIQYTDQFTVSPLGISSTSPSGTTTSSPATMKLSELRNLNSNTLGINTPSATVSLQKVDGDANLLANPRLRVRDREKAKILIGDKVPVVTTTTTPNGFLSENIQYLDVGLKLEVEPEVRLRDEIGLRLSLEVSSLVSVVKTSTGTQAYQIGTRNVNTVLRLKDGETQVLAGLISDSDRSSGSKLPGLGDLPLLGRLFGTQKDDRQKTEIVMAITPRLVRNMRRKDPAAESFWSGTEASPRTKALTLGTFDDASPVDASTPAAPARQMQQPQANDSGVKLVWTGPAQAKVGEVIKLALGLDSEHLLRATPLQLVFNPAMFELLAVEEGAYFNRDGKSAFNQAIDKVSGRISVGVSGSGNGAKGSAPLLTVSLRARAAGEAEIGVTSLIPVGAVRSVAQPPLPIGHNVTIAP